MDKATSIIGYGKICHSGYNLSQLKISLIHTCWDLEQAFGLYEEATRALEDKDFIRRRHIGDMDEQIQRMHLDDQEQIAKLKAQDRDVFNDLFMQQYNDRYRRQQNFTKRSMIVWSYVLFQHFGTLGKHTKNTLNSAQRSLHKEINDLKEEFYEKFKKLRNLIEHSGSDKEDPEYDALYHLIQLINDEDLGGENIKWFAAKGTEAVEKVLELVRSL